MKLVHLLGSISALGLLGSQVPVMSRPVASTIEVRGAAYLILDSAGVPNGITGGTDWVVWPGADGLITVRIDPLADFRGRAVVYIGPEPDDDREPWPTETTHLFAPATRLDRIETLLRVIGEAQTELAAMGPVTQAELNAALARINQSEPISP